MTLAHRIPNLRPRAAVTLAAALGLTALMGLGGTGRAVADPGAAAAPADQPEEGGALLLQTSNGPVEALRLGADVDVTVSGPIMRTRVTQAYRNTTGKWVEAIYTYPMAEDGAVDSLKMVVGDRVIVGEIRKKAEAKAAYDQAKAEGKAAGLAEQVRPNMFINSVANIGPGQTVLVQIEYQEPVRRSGDAFQLRVPLVVGTRYQPPSQAAGQAVPEPPVVDPRTHAPVNPVSITVHLKPGFPLAGITSPYHPIKVADDGADGRTVTLAERQVPANRDFELDWKAAPSTAPAASLFHETLGGKEYVLAMVTPPSRPLAGPELPREVVLVIDNSGSMGGDSIRQAKASLLYALSRLKPGDRFNVVRFDDTLDVLFKDTVPADAEHLERARRFVTALEARGGTEMLPAMRAALADPRPHDQGDVRQVVFLTDGEISNEKELFEEIGAERGRSRVFMVGIGSAPNTFLMTRASELGRGTFTHIGAVNEVGERMRGLFDKLEKPAATGLVASFSGVKADVSPANLPDLYAGEPVVLAAEVSGLQGQLKITGTVGGRPWTVSLPLSRAQPGRGVSKLWARRKIADAEVADSLGKMSGEDADKQVLSLGLTHHLVTSQTSLVAIDHTPVRPKGAHLTRSELPINLPAGWDFDRLFGPGADAARQDPSETGQTGQALELPQTGTDADLLLLAGAALCLIGGGVLLHRTRRRRPAAEA